MGGEQTTPLSVGAQFETRDQHPMRQWGVLVYHCPDAPADRAYVAFFTEPQASICFWGSDPAEVRTRALQWRDRHVEANEATYQKRLAASRKGAEARKRRAAAKRAAQ